MYLTFAETCERLRLSEETVRRLIKSGALTASKTGPGLTSPYRIDEKDLLAYLRRQREAARKYA